MSHNAPDCQFCEIPPQTLLVHRNFWAKLDPYPVSPGHALIIPIRHIDSIFDLAPIDLTEMFSTAFLVRRLLQEQHTPDGWNLGINDGAAAGRTIHHLHLHLIPRYAGDVDDPRGGVRNLMPHAPHPDAWSARPYSTAVSEPVDWDAVGRDVRDRAGQWVRVATYPARATAGSIAYQINNQLRHPALFRHGQFRARSRTVGDEHQLHLRWLSGGER